MSPFRFTKLTFLALPSLTPLFWVLSAGPCLQAGQEYARRQEARMLAKFEKEQKDAEATVKKDQ